MTESHADRNKIEVAKIAKAVFATPILALVLLTSAYADEPQRAPEFKIICSPNGLVCASMDPLADITVVRRDNVVLWSMGGWYRIAAIADDGDHLIFGNDGSNLLPLNANGDTVILTFVYRGDVFRTVTLSEVLVDVSDLKRTASHLYWGRYFGLDASGNYVIETVEGTRLAYDVTTGLPN